MSFQYELTNGSYDSYYISKGERKMKVNKEFLMKRLNKYLYQQEVIRKKMMFSDHDQKMKNSGAISELRKLIRILENE